MLKLKDEIVDAAIAFADAVKAHKRAAQARDDLREQLRAADVAVTDAEILERRARRSLDRLTQQVAADQLLEESFQRDGRMCEAGAA